MENYKKQIEQLKDEISSLETTMHEKFDELEIKEYTKRLHRIIFWTGFFLPIAFTIGALIFLRLFM